MDKVTVSPDKKGVKKSMKRWNNKIYPGFDSLGAFLAGLGAF